MRNDQGRPREGGPEVAAGDDHDIVQEIERKIADLELVECECETFGWCWSCAEIIRLRERMQKGAA